MRSRYFIIFAVLATLFGLFQLSSNAKTAARLRDAVVAKDEAGGDVKTDLAKLEQFVYSHINANTRVELTGSYKRAVAATQPPVPSGEMYAQAQAACGGRSSSVVQAKCVTDYVSKRLPPPPKPAELPSRALFIRVYNSPSWAPDLSGLSFLGAVIALVIAGYLRLTGPKK